MLPRNRVEEAKRSSILIVLFDMALILQGSKDIFGSKYWPVERFIVCPPNLGLVTGIIFASGDLRLNYLITV